MTSKAEDQVIRLVAESRDKTEEEYGEQFLF
jgi:hypothetical protein